MMLNVHSLMQHFSFGGKPVLLPELFKMNERILSFTEQYVLKRGDGDQIVFGIHL
jgi:hypothetical protein